MSTRLSPEPCPKCGAPAVVSKSDDFDGVWYYVHCKRSKGFDCPQDPTWGKTRGAAVREWNAAAAVRPESSAGQANHRSPFGPSC